MKRLISVTLLILSALIIFNLCFFLCVDYDGNERAWICYLFFHLAYILSMMGFFFTTRRRFVVLNNSLYVISITYLILTAITCLIFCVRLDYSYEIEIIVFLIELLLYILSFHYCYLTNRKAEKGVVKDLKNSSKHNNWVGELNMLKSISDGKEKTKILNSIIDEIKSCPVLSNPYVYDVDNEIQSMICSLKNNFNSIQVTELESYKSRISSAARRRSEILKCSHFKK